MDPENQTTTENTQAPAETATAPSNGTTAEKMLPQSKVNEIVARERREAIDRATAETERRLRAEFEAKQTREPEKAKKPADPDDRLAKFEAELRLERSERLFAEKLADLARKPDEKQKKTLRNAWDPENPAAFADLVDVLALNTAPPTPPPQPDDDPKPKAPAVPYSSPGAASAPPESDYQIDGLKWTKDDIARWREDGSFKARVMKWRNSLPGGAGSFMPTKIPKK